MEPLQCLFGELKSQSTFMMNHGMRVDRTLNTSSATRTTLTYIYILREKLKHKLDLVNWPSIQLQTTKRYENFYSKYVWFINSENKIYACSTS